MKMNSEATFSRRGVILGFTAILVFPAVPTLAKGRRSRGEPDAKKFLGSIYQRYLGKSSAGTTGVSLIDAQSVRSYFTPGLSSLILEDRAAAAKKGGPPVLDNDPFVGRSEWDISDLSIGVKNSDALKTVGTVTFSNFGRLEKVVLELLRLGKEWRIADVEWDSGTLRALYRRNAAYDGEAVP
jgi:hypothetical protein